MLGKSSGDLKGGLRQLKDLDLNQISKPKTLVIVHFCGKRISIPLFDQVLNLTQMMVHHLRKLQAATSSPQEQLTDKILCFEVKRDMKEVFQPEKHSQGDLRTDILLSLLRQESSQISELSFIADITKLYKYLEIQPLFRENEPENSYLLHKGKKQANNKLFPFLQFYRCLGETGISSNYLARKPSDGYFYTVKVYPSSSHCGLEDLKTIEHLQTVDQSHKDSAMRCSLLVRSHRSALIPHPELQDDSDEQGCRYIALVWPYFARGTLEQLIREAMRFGRVRRVSEMDCLNYLKELMWGVHILHEKYNLVHRAIIPSNLQIDQNGVLRLSNYYACLPCYDSEGQYASYNSKYRQSRQPRHPEENFEAGQYDIGEYTAPEVSKGQAYNYLVDFYSIGVIIGKLYEISQAHERAPVSQSKQTFMTTIISRLTSSDLGERQAIVEEIIQDIQRQNLEGESNPTVIALGLGDIKVGRNIEISLGKKYIEKQQASNGVDLDIVVNYFQHPRNHISSRHPKRPSKKISKEKNSVKVSRQKSQKCLSKASEASSKQRIRSTKKKTDSFSKEGQRIHAQSPNQKRQSKSKSQDKKKKESVNASSKIQPASSKPSLLPKSPKNLQRPKSPILQGRSK